MILLANGKPRFKIYNKTNALHETIDLDLTLLPGGLAVNYKKIFVEHNIIDYSADPVEWAYGQPYKERLFIGWNLFFTLYYEPWHGDDLTWRIGKLIDHANLSNFRVEFFPRLDDISFKTDIIDLNDDINIALINGVPSAKAYRGLILNFQASRPVKSLAWIKSTTPVYHGHLIPMSGQLQT